MPILGVIVLIVVLAYNIRLFEKDSDIGQSGKNISMYLDGEGPDDSSKALAKILSVDARFVASTGREIKGQKLTYEVTSWEITKQVPICTLAVLSDVLEYKCATDGMEVDDTGNIVDERFSYVIVNLRIKNIGKSNEEFYWNNIRLKGVRDGKSFYSVAELHVLGESQSREYDKNYFRERLQESEYIEMPLIYITEKELIDQKQLYLEINPSGVAVSDEELDEYTSRRMILLN